MKLVILIAAVVNGYLAFEAAPLISRASCPMVEACSSKKVDTCCVSEMGKVLFSLQWIDYTGPSDKFTVHGFWPDHCDGTQTPRSGCDRLRNYPNLMDHVGALNSSLIRQLNVNWPSYTGNNPAFWSHEWNKHGTCISTLDPHCYETYKKYEDAHDFFVNVMDLYSKYDYAASLKKANIIPGRVYPRADIVKAIEKDTGLQVALTCRGRSLREVRTWFQAVGRNGLKPIPALGHSSCPLKILFQKKSPGKIGVSSKKHELILHRLEISEYSL